MNSSVNLDKCAGILYNKQIQILNCIFEYNQQNGYAPSIREICQIVDLKSTSTVHSHLNKLEIMGYLRRYSDRPRAIVLTDKFFKELLLSDDTNSDYYMDMLTDIKSDIESRVLLHLDKTASREAMDEFNKIFDDAILKIGVR